MIIRKRAYPRAALIGNPSDGYYGKTIAFTFNNFHAEIILYQTPELEILPNHRDLSKFSSMEELTRDVVLHGYYGGIRLLKATVKLFYEYCMESGMELEQKNFTIRYSSTIPHQVGLAGSSAIITACMRALMAFYGVTVAKPMLANLVLDVEQKELGISAGLQDRVAQAYQGLVYMDFDKDVIDQRGYGNYEQLDESLLPPLYLAYRSDLSEGSEIVHNNLRERFVRREQPVLDAIEKWAGLTEQVKEALAKSKTDTISDLLNENFDIRNNLMRISDDNLHMVQTARQVGASAKFTGSGGAIIGTYTNENMLEQLRTAFDGLGVSVIIPTIALPAVNDVGAKG
ncbi:MAG: GHMP kinase [Chitinivibrionales bacterium]|nr:GHMP kinase [Chitinivibrionales bacterium]